MSGTEILGYITGAITSLTFLPQIIKTWRNKSVKDISLTMFLIAAGCEVLWIIYGALQNDWVIILTNVVVLAMSLTMIFFKIIYITAKTKRPIFQNETSNFCRRYKKAA
jgi:MtN3 and saliva related transmembrane protein